MEYRELKEAEHIYNVTLKNNRSLETFKAFLKAIAKLYDKIISDYLNKLIEENKINDLPKAPVLRAKVFLENVPHQDIKVFIEEYLTIRRCLISPAKVINEHRRNMEIIFETNQGEVKFALKDLKEVLERAKEFYNIMKKYL